MMRRGTLRKTFEQLNSETEERGMSVGVDAGRHTLSIGGRSLTEDADQLIDTIAEIARQPAFPLDEIERLRTLVLAGLKEDEDDTRSVAERAFRELAYPPDHPYHQRISGTLDTVPRLTRPDMVRFYRAYMRPDTAVMVIVGDIDPPAALAMVQRTFGDWQASGERPTITVPDAPRPTTIMRTVKVLAARRRTTWCSACPPSAAITPTIMPC